MALLSEILSAGIFATTAMTFFSYIMSFLFNSNFKEPQILNLLMSKGRTTESWSRRHNISGWIIHFLIGLFFVAIFKIIIIYFNVNLSYLNGLIYGLVGGISGVIVYSLAFALHPNPPENNRLLFFIQLVFAHIIFALVMVFYLKLL